MRHKVFKMVNGKLIYVGMREAREGDAILTGETSVAETINLREDINDVNADILASLSGKQKEDFKHGLHKLGMVDPEATAALRAAFKRAKPDATDRELDILVSGKAPKDDNPKWLEE